MDPYLARLNSKNSKLAEEQVSIILHFLFSMLQYAFVIKLLTQVLRTSMNILTKVCNLIGIDNFKTMSIVFRFSETVEAENAHEENGFVFSNWVSPDFRSHTRVVQ